MSLWTLSPRDPLIVRDGRPNHGRSESTTLPFPYPGTMAGIVRTRLGSDERGIFDPGQDLEALRRVALRGPLLVRLDDGALYVPRPRDAIAFGVDGGGNVLRRLAPLADSAGHLCDDALDGAPVGLASRDAQAPGKPAPSAAWWPWMLLARWLAEPGTMANGDADALLRDGLRALPTETRSHVKLGETWTAEEGMLFQARGLRFVTQDKQPLALAFDVATSTLGGRALREGIGPCGGERRLAHWEEAPKLTLPALPDGVRKALLSAAPSVRVRVVLLTPAIFTAGSKPGWLLAPRANLTPTFVAACVPRPETISGWDFAKRRPKASRRVVSAGSVYWLDLAGKPADRAAWAEEVMMSNISDDPQDRRDGFGLAAVGVGS